MPRRYCSSSLAKYPWCKIRIKGLTFSKNILIRALLSSMVGCVEVESIMLECSWPPSGTKGTNGESGISGLKGLNKTRRSSIYRNIKHKGSAPEGYPPIDEPLKLLPAKIQNQSIRRSLLGKSAGRQEIS